jgi:DNA repair exonuclease SbcCD ATPase subunit
MIKFQNKKIQDLYDELEKRDHKIQSLQSQLNGIDNYKFQMENFKRQTSVLEEKLRLYETDMSSKSVHLSDQLKQISEAEAKLRSQLIAKDKIIHDLDFNQKEQERHVSLLRKQLLEKDEINTEHKHEFNEITTKFKNISLKMELRDEEFKRYKEESELKLKEALGEKKMFEDKLNQMIEIVKQYSRELGEYNQKIKQGEADYNALQQLNDRQTEEIEQLIRSNKDLQEAMYAFKEVKSKIHEAETIIQGLENVINTERLRNENLSRSNQELLERYQLIKEKVSGDNNPETLRSVIQARENELNNISHNIDHLTKTTKIFEQKYKEVDNENKEIINFLNNEFLAIIQWVDTYFGVFFEHGINVPELPFTISKPVKNKLKIDTLKDCLFTARKKVNDELAKYDKFLKEAKKENTDCLHRIERQNTEISNLKNQILQKNEEVYTLHQELEGYQASVTNSKENFSKLKHDITERQDFYQKFLDKVYRITKDDLDNILRNDQLKSFHHYLNRLNYSDNLQNEVENNIEKVSQLLHCLSKDYETLLLKNEETSKLKVNYERVKKELHEKTRQYKEELEKLTRDKDNSLGKYEKIRLEELKVIEQTHKQNNEKLKQKLNEKEDLIMQVQQENLLMKSQLEHMDHNVKNTVVKEELNDAKDKNDKLSDSFKNLEKKYRSLLTEVELKEMQIKSQEQMLARRTQELQDLKSKNESSAKLNVSEDREKAKALEVKYNL